MSRECQLPVADWLSEAASTQRRGVSRFSSTASDFKCSCRHPLLEQLSLPDVLLYTQSKWYHTPLHFHGLTTGLATKYATIAGTFGVAAGTFALFFFGEIPRVRRDILQKVPFLDEYFDRTIAPEDNPF
ncbi:hypothetical protein AbraIFM66951_010660 [Aspergillus brasiliensis]|uniref:Ubiquinol-cytochrome-c reductase complex subunit-domain-containing protein n=1 Tax=Aspergillus brasiliensis TaxID=319629 RepID=A0A9W5YI51_9EURO|nr:hypothetical protein AbraCBS73388_005929 [Aspergillus brasiliensis]GKZ47304.1 hypothetical protein AbraIFM66951_010660 [Aspergillus brasiliensis]